MGIKQNHPHRQDEEPRFPPDLRLGAASSHSFRCGKILDNLTTEILRKNELSVSLPYFGFYKN